MHGLLTGLAEARAELPRAAWRRFVELARAHPLRALLHEDPLTRWAFQRPRGYPGDAVLLDMVYRQGEEALRLLAGGTPRGRRIHEWLLQHSGVLDIRRRRDLLAELIDEEAERTSLPHVLSIACGHLREAQLSRAVREGRVGRFVAFDQDEESLRLIQREQTQYGVEPIHGSIRTLLVGGCSIGEFDLVYAAGLLDYLPQHVAKRFVLAAFRLLRSGGRLVVSNVLPNVLSNGYMEAYMDWNLIYRSESDLADLGGALPGAEVAGQRAWTHHLQHFGFLEVVR